VLVIAELIATRVEYHLAHGRAFEVALVDVVEQVQGQFRVTPVQQRAALTILVEVWQLGRKLYRTLSGSDDG
jgi:hypothetical protein